MTPQHTRQEIIDEVEMLLPCTAERAAEGLGIKVDSLYRSLWRSERLDLWQRLTPDSKPRGRRRPKPEPLPDPFIAAAQQWLAGGDDYGTQRAIACALISIAQSLHDRNPKGKP